MSTSVSPSSSSPPHSTFRAKSPAGADHAPHDPPAGKDAAAGLLARRLDSATSTSTLALPTPSAPPTDPPASTTASSTTQSQRHRRRATPGTAVRTPPAASRSDDDDDDDDDYVTERARLLASHGLDTNPEEHTPLLSDAPPRVAETVTPAQRAAHRHARRVGMAATARTSRRTEFHTPLPWRALILTVFLFSFGSIALSTSLYLFLGYGNAKDPDKWQSLAVLGTLCMIPGGFYLWHFLMVALGVPGWSYDDIPEL